MESDTPRKRRGRPASGSPPEDLSSLASRVRYARTLRRLTQERLAELSGLQQGDISKIENGRILKTTGLPSLARALRCSVDWLDTGDGDKPANGATSGSAGRSSVNEPSPATYNGDGATPLRRQTDRHGGVLDAVVTLWSAVQGHTEGRRDAVLGLLKEALAGSEKSAARDVAAHIEALLTRDNRERILDVGNG